MEAVNKTNGAVYTIRKDNSGRWYGYCPQTKEYTPAFLKLKGLIGLLELKGYEIVEEQLIWNKKDTQEMQCIKTIENKR